LARKTAQDYPVAALVNSVNPTRIAGQASAAYEICDVLGRAPDIHCLPVGNAGNITAYWAGYRAYAKDGVIDALPRMFGFQAAGAAPLVHGAPVRHPETIATAIRIGAPASWTQAVAARDESDGRFAAVTDDEILAAYRLLSAREAVFVEPASAASVAGLLQSAENATLPQGSLVVCTVTGHGLKDPDTALLAAPEPTVVPIDPGCRGGCAGAAVTGVGAGASKVALPSPHGSKATLLAPRGGADPRGARRTGTGRTGTGRAAGRRRG
jgi:threonine synthase